jgi:transposase
MEYWDHTIGPRERVALRAAAVGAVNSGEKKCRVAQRLGVTRQTLHNWVERHRRGGTAALAARPRGRSRRRVHEPWQEAQRCGRPRQAVPTPPLTAATP